MRWIGFAFLGFLSLILIAALSLWAWLPSAKNIRGCLVTSMYHVNLCPGSKDYTSIKQISPYLQKTVVLTEDSNFFNHHGFEWDTIEKNFRDGWEKGAFKRGGSTITQQLAKNMYLSKSRTFIRKGLEAIITDRIEKALTKKEILERYLNVVEFGKEIYGVKNAANYYFKKSPAELDVVESAFLAMVLPNPTKYSRSYFKKELTPFARKRLNRIVGDMFQYHRINEEEYNVAVSKIQNFFNLASVSKETDSSVDDSLTLEDLEKVDSENTESHD